MTYEREYLSRCECCHKLRYGCQDIDYGDECWHVCARCAQADDPWRAYIDPDDARDMRMERDRW